MIKYLLIILLLPLLAHSAREFDDTCLTTTGAVVSAQTFTVVLWANTDTSESAAMALIWSVANSGNTDRHEISVGANDLRQSRFATTISGTAAAVTSTGTAAEVWTHYAGKTEWTGSTYTDRNAYIDGGDEAFDGGDRASLSPDRTTIAGRDNSTLICNYIGRIAHPAVYAADLTAAEIGYLGGEGARGRAISPLRFRRGDLVSYVPMGSGGATAVDVVTGQVYDEAGIGGASPYAAEPPLTGLGHRGG